MVTATVLRFLRQRHNTSALSQKISKSISNDCGNKKVRFLCRIHFHRGVSTLGRIENYGSYTDIRRPNVAAVAASVQTQHAADGLMEKLVNKTSGGPPVAPVAFLCKQHAVTIELVKLQNQHMVT